LPIVLISTIFRKHRLWSLLGWLLKADFLGPILNSVWLAKFDFIFQHIFVGFTSGLFFELYLLVDQYYLQHVGMCIITILVV
jgi:hypothetical protein